MKNKMISLSVIVIILTLLSGCFGIPVSSQPGQVSSSEYPNSQNTADVLIQSNAAKMTQNAAQPYLDATSTVQAYAIMVATMQTGATMSALSVQLTLDSANVKNTESAYNLQSTQAIDTETAYGKTSTAISKIEETKTAVPPTQTALAAIFQSEERQREKDRLVDEITTYSAPLGALFWAVLPLVVIVLIVVGIVVLFRRLSPIVEARSRYIKQANGEMVYLSGSGDVVTLTRAPTGQTYGPSITITPAGAMVSGIPSPDLQSQVNQQAFLVGLARAYQPGVRNRELEELFTTYLQRASHPAQGEQLIGTGDGVYPMINTSNIPTEASWNMIMRYRGDGLPVGLLDSGEILDPSIDDVPHRLFAGATGAGKSRRGARPAIAMALARGFVVFSIGDMPAPDFRVFDGHPNYHAAVVDQSEDILTYIQAANVEVKRRWQMLYDNSVSMWSLLPNKPPRVMIVIDEYAALMDNLENQSAKLIQNQIANLSRLARKAGIHLLLGAQNPTRDSVRPSIRRNVLTVFFRTTDPAASLAIMGAAGAEQLQDRQFLARIPGGDIQRGVAFDPTDNDIENLLDSGISVTHKVPEWLEATPSPSLISDDSQEFVYQDAKRQDTRTEQIIDLYKSQVDTGKINQASIEKAVYGYTGGRASRAVRAAIDDYLVSLESTTTTTSAI